MSDSQEGMTRQFLLSDWKLPVRAADFGADLDGDGHIDNRFGALISAMLQNGMNLQSNVDQAVTDGRSLVLFTLDTERPEIATEQSAELSMVRALGTGEADPFATAITLTGRLTNRRFTPTAPPLGSDLTTWQLELPLGPGLPAELPIQWPRAEFTIDPAGTRLVGRVIGSVAGPMILGSLVPSLASAFTLFVSTNPASSVSQTIKQLFDTGGCVNPDGSQAVGGDGRIDPCELSQNPLIRALLAPDIRLGDSLGHYHPAPGGTPRDCLSLGVGFGAVAQS